MTGIAPASVSLTARSVYQNFLGVGAASVLLFASLLPVTLTLPFGLLAAVGGLWTTALLNGLVLAPTFGFTTAVAVSDGPLRARDHVSVTETYRTGFAVGIGTFVASLPLLVAVFAPTTGVVRWTSLGVTASLVPSWYTLVALSNEEIGRGDALRRALMAGLVRFRANPLAAAWFLVASVVLALFSGITVVTVVLLLPGTLAVFASTVTDNVDATR